MGEVQKMLNIFIIELNVLMFQWRMLTQRSQPTTTSSVLVGQGAPLPLGWWLERVVSGWRGRGRVVVVVVVAHWVLTQSFSAWQEAEIGSVVCGGAGSSTDDWLVDDHPQLLQEHQRRRVVPPCHTETAPGSLWTHLYNLLCCWICLHYMNKGILFL